MSETVVQTKFQRQLQMLSKISFWIWIFTLLIFVTSVIFTRNPDNFKLVPGWVFLGNIGLGVVAFIVAVLSRFVSTPRSLEETKSIYKTLSIGAGGLALLIILGLISPHDGNVSGARKYGSPIPDITLTTNKTVAKTPAPSTAPNQQYKPKATQVDCIGPDYKTFQTTPEACAKFRTDWGLPATATVVSAPQTPQNNNNGISCTTVYGTYKLSPSDCSYFQALHSAWQSDFEASKSEIDSSFALIDEKNKQALGAITNITISPMPSIAPITVSPFPTIQPEPTPQNCYWKVNDYGAQFYYCQ